MHSTMSRRLALFVCSTLLVGCYELQPARGGMIPDVGKMVALDLNDAGRAAMGGAMGPEIAQVEGRLINNGATEYVIGVTSVHYLRMGDQVWKGEQVSIKKEYVTSVYERTFSKSHTIAAAAIGVGLAAALIGRSIIGHADPEQPTFPDTAQTSRRPGAGRLPLPVRP
jgi:hypothetical protein